MHICYVGGYVNDKVKWLPVLKRSWSTVELSNISLNNPVFLDYLLKASQRAIRVKPWAWITEELNVELKLAVFLYCWQKMDLAWPHVLADTFSDAPSHGGKPAT